jgi:DNA-binding Lrp family transcriptional regulator
VLAKLAYMQRYAKMRFDGKAWFVLPMRVASGKADRNSKYRALAQYFPWIDPSSIQRLVEKLKDAGYIKVGQHNARQGDKTFWYHVPEKVCKAVAASIKRYFNPAEAASPLSINCALVLNVVYRDFHLKVTKQDQRLVFNYRALSRDLGLPVSTVRSVFEKLEEQGYLLPTVVSEGKAYTLNVPNPCLLKGNGQGRKSVSKVIYVVLMAADDYSTTQKMLQEGNAIKHETTRKGKLTQLQMLEEFYLWQIEREQIKTEKKAEREAAKQKRVRRACFPDKETRKVGDAAIEAAWDKKLERRLHEVKSLALSV